MTRSAATPQSFVDFLHDLNSRPECERWACVDHFMNLLNETPYVEKDTFVHFIFRGDASSVTVPCDANEWNPIEFGMKRVEGTNFWYYTLRLEPDARLDYKFVLNGCDWILDPLNPQQIDGGFGPNSELRMPKYIPPREIEYHPEIPAGTVTDICFRSETMDNTRTICIYTPYNYQHTAERYPLVVFHDGMDFLSLGCAKNILDYLIARRRMKPVIAVFVPPVNRNAEYAGTHMDQFYCFIADELLPFLDRSYRTACSPADRATIGVSNSGNISLFLGLHYPETFGNIAALSGNVVSSVYGGYENSPRLAVKFYLDMGTYDIPQLVPLVKSFAGLISSKGYSYIYRKYHEGHSWGNWRAHVGRALEYFYPPKVPVNGRRHHNRDKFKPVGSISSHPSFPTPPA